MLRDDTATHRDAFVALKRATPWLSLVLMTALTWWHTLPYGFVNWDDGAYVLNNPLIRGWTLSNLHGIATEVVTRNYAPLTIFTFLVDHSFWGLEAWGYRLTNLLLHSVNGLLVFALMQRFCRSTYAAWLTAALFIVHPVQVESVVWISSRKNLLCSALMLSAVVVRLRERSTPRQEGWYLLLLIMALLARAHAIILPPIVLLYDLLIARRRTPEAIAASIIPGLLGLLLLIMTMGAQNTVGGGVRTHMEIGLFRILEADSLILWEYIRMLLAPTVQCVMYDPPISGIHLSAFVAAIAWAVIGVTAWRIRHKSPLFLFGLLTALLLLLPVLNITPITTLMNDRYLYLPCLIVFALVASSLAIVTGLVSAGQQGRILTIGVRTLSAGLLLGGCVLRTLEYQPVWQDSFSLWQHALSQYPDMPVFRIQAAVTESERGRFSTASALVRRALQECDLDEFDEERMRRSATEWQQQADRQRLAVSTGNSIRLTADAR